MSDLKKIFVLDTNVLVHSSRAIHSFGENTVIISFTVLEELDKLKKGTGEINKNAREVVRFMDSLREKGNLSVGVEMPNKCILRIFSNHQKDIKDEIKRQSLDPVVPDNRIIATALYLKRKNQQKSEVIFISQDINARLKADALGLEVGEYYGESVRVEETYLGYRTLKVLKKDIDHFYSKGSILLSDEIGLYPNEFVILADGNKNSAIGRAKSEKIIVKIDFPERIYGVVLKNKEQKMAVNLLLDPEIKVVSLLGVAGTGKTLLAVACALDLVLKENFFEKIIVTRPIIPMGNDIGYLPGSKDNKLGSWMQPIFDNLDFLLKKPDHTKKEGNLGSAVKGKITKTTCQDDLSTAKGLISSGLLEMEALTYMRGRTISGTYVIIDEAQNLTPEEVKAICTRCGEGSKFVFTGDPDQIDNPYLDSCSNGLSVMVERSKSINFTGHMTLERSERSEVASIFSQIM